MFVEEDYEIYGGLPEGLSFSKEEGLKISSSTIDNVLTINPSGLQTQQSLLQGTKINPDMYDSGGELPKWLNWVSIASESNHMLDFDASLFLSSNRSISIGNVTENTFLGMDKDRIEIIDKSDVDKGTKKIIISTNLEMDGYEYPTIGLYVNGSSNYELLMKGTYNDSPFVLNGTEMFINNKINSTMYEKGITKVSEMNNFEFWDDDLYVLNQRIGLYPINSDPDAGINPDNFIYLTNNVFDFILENEQMRCNLNINMSSLTFQSGLINLFGSGNKLNTSIYNAGITKVSQMNNNAFWDTDLDVPLSKNIFFGKSDGLDYVGIGATLGIRWIDANDVSKFAGFGYNYFYMQGISCWDRTNKKFLPAVIP